MTKINSTSETIRCPRCSGRKKIFKVGSCYSLINTGGVEVDCPMCRGDGRVKTLAETLKDNPTLISDELIDQPTKIKKRGRPANVEVRS